MRKAFIGGNWKMHGDTESLNELITGIKQHQFKNLDAVVFPSFVYLEQIRKALGDHQVKLGGQNCCDHEQGAYTGEIAPNMLADIGCDYVLLGHSERRHVYNETDRFIARKFVLARKHHLIPVLCVGETELQRDIGETKAILTEQLDAVINDVGIHGLKDTVIAYEPVWAIGTGKVATPEMAQAAHQFIREHIASHDQALAENIRIIYGGSLKPENAAEIFAMPDVDGGLIGGASLKADSFCALIDLASLETA